MAEFVDAYNAELDVTKRLPLRGLALLTGWVAVEPVEKPTAQASKPATIAEVLAHVGDNPQNAAAALAEENARPNPRTTLVDALTAITEHEES